MHANQFNMNWFYDPILKGKYPEYVVKQLEKSDLLPDWTAEELLLIEQAAPLNDFMGLNYYQPMRVEKIKGPVDHVITLDNSTGRPGNPSFDQVYKTVKMENKKYTKWYVDNVINCI